MKAVTLNSTEHSHDAIDQPGTHLDPNETIIRHPGGDQLVRKLCQHFQPDSMIWPTRVLLVQMKEKIMHSNIVKFLGIAFHEELWKVVTLRPAKGKS
jgi:hypothetical protein